MIKATKAARQTAKQNFIAPLKLMPCMSHATQAIDATNGTCLNSLLPALDNYSGVRLVYHNYSTTTPLVIDDARAASATSTITIGNNSGTLTWVRATKDGATTLTVPVASVGNSNGGADPVPGILVTDLIPIRNVAVGSYVRVASHVVNTQTNCSMASSGSNHVAALNSKTGLTHGSYNFGSTAAGMLTSVSNILSSGGATNPVGAIFYSLNPQISACCFGDSILQGVGNSDGYAIGAVELVTTDSLTDPIKIATANYARAGQTTYDTYQSVRQFVAAGIKPNYIIFKCWSPNDSTSTANVDTAWMYALEIIRICLENNIVPVILTAVPNTTDAYTTVGSITTNSNIPNASWANIAVNNARVKQLSDAVLKIDAYTLLHGTATTDGQWDSRFLLGNTANTPTHADGTHPTKEAHQALADLIRAQIKIFESVN